MTVIIDFRNIAKISSFSILSGAYACSWPTEPGEIAHRLAQRLYCISLDYPGHQLILANDKPPYWRASFINNWYAERQQEPVPYKGNRVGMAWQFKSSPEQLNERYDLVEKQMARALGAIIAEDVGLEADDIWGILASTAKEPIIGISSDSDWRQLCGPNVTVVDPTTNAHYTEPADIMPKIVAGDRGDNIMGCRKFKKDGTLGTMWGIEGAKKLIEKGGDWSAKLDKDVLDRNYSLIKLPCPEWDIGQALTSLQGCMKPAEGLNAPEANGILDTFGINEANRALLSQKAAREQWIMSMRAHFMQKNAEESVQGSAPEEPKEAVAGIPELPNGATVDLGLKTWTADTAPLIRVNCLALGHPLQKEYVSSGVIRYRCPTCNYMFSENTGKVKGA